MLIALFLSDPFRGASEIRSVEVILPRAQRGRAHRHLYQMGCGVSRAQPLHPVLRRGSSNGAGPSRAHGLTLQPTATVT